LGFYKSCYIFLFDQFIQFFIGFNSPQTISFLGTSHPMITIQKHCCLCQFAMEILHNQHQPNKTCLHYYPIKFHYKPSGNSGVNIFLCMPTERHTVRTVVP